MQIQWFPGHMTKTRRMIEADLKLIDIVFEIVDARIPKSSKNPDLDALIQNKPRLFIMNKTDLADDTVSALWERYFKTASQAVCRINSQNGAGYKNILLQTKEILKDKLARDNARGIINRKIKIMVLGIPNVGKSTFINRLSGKASTKTGDRPGVTRGKQWISLPGGFDLLDTPGILWPKFDDTAVALNLAYTGAIKDEIIDTEELACHLLLFLKNHYPDCLADRYKLTGDISGLDGYELLTLTGKNRGFIVSGGEVDTLRAANVVLDEFRGGKLGKISLEKPEEL